MTLCTVTYDDSTHKLVPNEPTEEMIFSGNLHSPCQEDAILTYQAMIAAAPEYQEHDTDKLISDLKSSLQECMNEAAGWLDECRGCTPEDLMNLDWHARAKALLDQEPKVSEG